MSAPQRTLQDTDTSGRQSAILAYVRQHLAVQGWPPTYRMIGAACGISSPSMVSYHLHRLERLGYLRLGGGARTIALTDRGDDGEHSPDAA